MRRAWEAAKSRAACMNRSFLMAERGPHGGRKARGSPTVCVFSRPRPYLNSAPLPGQEVALWRLGLSGYTLALPRGCATGGSRRNRAVCGIIGYVGNREAEPILVGGLRRLEYRGYDSAGLVTLA